VLSLGQGQHGISDQISPKDAIPQKNLVAGPSSKPKINHRGISPIVKTNGLLNNNPSPISKQVSNSAPGSGQVSTKSKRKMGDSRQISTRASVNATSGNQFGAMLTADQGSRTIMMGNISHSGNLTSKH